MFRELDPVEVLPCACCGQPATNGFWHTHLCDECYRAWQSESPTCDDTERAHAAKHPEDVEARGDYQFIDAAQKHHDWLRLKPGIPEKVAEAAARAWLTTRQKSSRRSA